MSKQSSGREAQERDVPLIRENVCRITDLEAELQKSRGPIDCAVDAVSAFCGSVTPVVLKL